MIVAGILASMAMTQVWELVALWGVIVGVGTGMVALVLGATIATRWFVQRRGLVVGMLTASSATGQLIFLPLIAKLTQDYGWRSALVFVVAMLLVAGVRRAHGAARPPGRCRACAVRRARHPAGAEAGSGAFGDDGVAVAGALRGAREPHFLGLVRDLLSSAAFRPTASSRRIGSRSAATMASRRSRRPGRSR